MKVIDLLNKIANGEEVPHFIIDEQEYYVGADGFLKEIFGDDVEWTLDARWLNEEVEIIEEKTNGELKDDFTGLRWFKNGNVICAYAMNESSPDIKNIEVEKDIKYIHYHDADNEMECNGRMYRMRAIDKGLIEKINELIDVVNELKKEK